MTVPEYLKGDESSVVENSDRIIPRLTLCQSMTGYVTDGKAEAGDWFCNDIDRVFKEAHFHVVAYNKTWKCYEKGDRNSDLLWEKPDSADVRAQPECQWGENGEPPQAALSYNFVVYVVGFGLARMSLSRSAVNTAKALLTMATSLGNGLPLHAGEFELASSLKKKGGTSYYIPRFVYTGNWCTQELDQYIRAEEPYAAKSIQRNFNDPFKE